LKSIPKTLDETYERILLAVDEEYRDFAVEALRWLCFSQDVLTIEELAEAAVFSATVEGPSKESPLKVSFDRDDLIQDPLDLMSILSGLVVYRPPDDGSYNSDYDTDDDDYVDDPDPDEDLHPRPEINKAKSEILLSHFSVKEYLVSGRLGSRVDRFAIDERRAHEILATKCIYFILYCQEFLEYSEKSKGYRPTFRCPFFYYASACWKDHAQTVEYESKLSYLIISLFEPEQPLKGLFPGEREDDQKSGDITPLYHAAFQGLYWPCKKLIENGADVNMQGGYYGNPLQAASMKGRENIVQLLLHHGATVNLQGGHHGSALQAAICTGKESIVNVLLEHGANVNRQGGHYRNALQAAIYTGKESIVNILLEHGANVNMRGGIYGYPLRAALFGGGESIVRLLLDHGADVNIQGGLNGSPLYAAIEYGRQSAFQLLLDHGANISSQTGHYDDVLDPYYDSPPRPKINTKIPVILLEHGAVMSKFHGGIEAEEALARKDFKRFVAIQVEARKEKFRMRSKKHRRYPLRVRDTRSFSQRE
jgi:ankyrin repeat protein